MSIKYRTCEVIWNGKGSRFVIRLKPFNILINIFMPAARLFANSLHKKNGGNPPCKSRSSRCVLCTNSAQCAKKQKTRAVSKLYKKLSSLLSALPSNQN
jgi:phosphoribosyl-dephospho-CoA transferase